jgi:hypothetical protein
MPDTQVNVPAVGRVKKTWVYVGLAAAGSIAAYSYWRRSQDTTAPAPGEGDISAADLTSPDAFVNPGGSTVIPDSSEQPPFTNADWFQRVLDLLEAAGVDRTLASQTLGKYLAGNPLNTAEKLIIQQAKGLLGPPPAGDLPIISAPETPPPSGTGTPPSPVPPSGAPAKVTGLHVHARNANKSVSISWNRASGAAQYAVYRNGGRINIVSVPGATVGPPAAGSYTVKAINSKGVYGAASSALRL